MPYCSNCGGFIESDKKFCGNCGSPNEKYEANDSQSVNQDANNSYQTQPQAVYYTPYQNTSQVYYQPQNHYDVITEKKNKRALAFSIVTFVLSIISIFVAEGFSFFGTIFFIPAIINTIQHKTRSGKLNKLALIFTIIGGALSTLIMFIGIMLV